MCDINKTRSTGELVHHPCISYQSIRPKFLSVFEINRSTLFRFSILFNYTITMESRLNHFTVKEIRWKINSLKSLWYEYENFSLKGRVYKKCWGVTTIHFCLSHHTQFINVPYPVSEHNLLSRGTQSKRMSKNSSDRNKVWWKGSYKRITRNLLHLTQKEVLVTVQINDILFYFFYLMKSSFQFI